MGYLFIQQPKLNISFRPDYRKACFGLFHVAFVDNHDEPVLCEEDRESIEKALLFYQERICKRESYPVFDGKNYVLKDVSDPEVLFQVLGLPDVVTKRLDAQKDILSQLHFVSGLTGLKKECYFSLSKEFHRKWYSDDFKLYCLKNGVFFLYDETKPFVERESTFLPVYVNPSLLPKSLINDYHEATSVRFAIDILGVKDDKQFNEQMRKLDGYSFDRRLSFFINDEYDEELSELTLDPVFKRKYCYILRQYFASLINVLYDDYCFEVLHKVTAKLSFLSLSKLQTDRDIFSYSSYAADMYSLDKKNFFFSDSDRIKIQENANRLLEEDPNVDILTLYARLGLPFEGYYFVSHLQDITGEGLVACLPFSDMISSSERYLSAKRFDSFYSYLSGEREHRHAFLIRKLSESGIQYVSSSPLLDLDEKNQITIQIKNVKRSRPLAHLFDYKYCSFREEILPSYLMDRKKLEDRELENALETLDRKSHGQAVSYFYHAFHDYTLNRVIDLMLISFDLQELKGLPLHDFLAYALLYPLRIAEKDYRLFCLSQGDTMSLVALDGLPRQKDSFEPNMPYPYVSFGRIAYSFRQSYFSKSYLCECQKEAILSKVRYLQETYEKNHSHPVLAEENAYIVARLGLPEDILSRLNLDRDLVLQLPFKKHICHLCISSSPSQHEHIDDNEEERHNVFLTYIRAKAGLKGVYFDTAMSMDYDMSSFFDSLSDKTYRAVLSFDRTKIDPILLPYVNISKKMIVSLMAAFFANELTYDDFYQEVMSFMELDESRIQKLLFDCSPSDYGLIYSHMMIFTRLVYLYKMIEISYALYVSGEISPRNENEFCLNLDYNPRLPHPYVILGSTYCAYADSLSENNYYLCQCDKEPMLSFASRFVSLYEERKMNPEYKTAIVLGLVGLPYLVILKYASFDLEHNSVEDLFEEMNFKEEICRRELNINHAAYSEPFRKAFPFKEDMLSDYDFALSGMAHDHFKLISDYALIDITYRPSHRYDVNAYDDALLPFFDYSTPTIPEPLFTYFVMNKDNLRYLLKEFSSFTPERAEIDAYASSVILDSYERDDKAILNFVFSLASNKTLRAQIEESFPEISRVRPSYLEEVMQTILGFMTYVIEQLIEHYAVKESHIGR